MDKGGERVSKIPKDRYSHQTFYTCEGGYDDIEPEKAEPDYANIINENDPSSRECLQVFQQKFKQQIEESQNISVSPNLNDSRGSQIMTRTTFESLDPEVRKYLIYDQDTCQVIDLTDGKDVTRSLVVKKSPKFDEKQAWKQFWNDSKRLREDLLDAAEIGDEKAVREILEIKALQNYVDVNARGLDDMTPLHFGCQESNLIIVTMLLQHNAQVNVKSSFHRTPLHLAVMRGSFEITKLLLLNKAEPNAQDKEQQTALHMASQQGYDQIVTLLLEYKADSTIKNDQNSTAFDLAQNTRVREVFQLFGVHSENSYTRVPMPGTELMRPGRNDHIKNLLKIYKANPTEENSVKQNENSKPQTPIQTPKRILQYTKIPVYQGTTSNTQQIQGKLGPDSFIFYQLLGKGSFGEVYLVERQGQVPPKPYAMKILKKDRMISQNLMKYAQTEKDVLSIMHHPFIVGLNYAFQTETKLFLVMDFCPGGDLSNLLDLKRKLSEDVAKIYVSEILLALETLHKNNIIYRDLKPENVVLDSEGHAMLTDFGLSKKGVQEGVLNKSFCGSPAYLPPEILSRSGHNRQVDWYLLGVMTYELLVGIPPYYANEREALFENIKKGPLKMPRSLSPEAKDFIVQLLNRDPYKRLGAKGDGEEIKQHPWLRDIDWKECYNRKLKPPKPDVKQFSKVPLNIKFADTDSQRNKQDGWTFIESN